MLGLYHDDTWAFYPIITPETSCHKGNGAESFKSRGNFDVSNPVGKKRVLEILLKRLGASIGCERDEISCCLRRAFGNHYSYKDRLYTLIRRD